MALFPFFVNLEGANGLIVGGGHHALEKVERLRPFGPRLTVFASAFCRELEEDEQICRVYREFQDGDLASEPLFVIVAGEDAEENHRIAELCREKKILVNVVDDQAYCDFIFPSLITKGNLTIGINTNGASPSTGVLLKRKVEALIPEHMEEILEYLQSKRPEISQRLSNKKKRFAFYYALSEACMEKDRPLTEEEFLALLEANDC